MLITLHPHTTPKGIPEALLLNVMWLDWVDLCILECIEGHLSWRWLDFKLLSAIVHIWGYWKSFYKLKKTSFELVERNHTYMKVLKVIRIYENMIWVHCVELCTFEGIKIVWVDEEHDWGCWMQLYTFEGIEIIFKMLRMRRHIWVEARGGQCVKK